MSDEQQNEQPEETIETSIEKLKKDLDSAMDGWKRTAADFENYRRRKEEEGKELVTFAREVTVAKLLPSLDSLEQALRHMPKYTTSPSQSEATPPLQEESGPSSPPKIGGVPTAGGGGGMNFEKAYENWQTGINGLVMQLDKALEELGVKKIEAVGKKFDPHLHEAVREVESDQEDGTVVEEFQTGFELNGKVIRPSQVVISKKRS